MLLVLIALCLGAVYFAWAYREERADRPWGPVAVVWIVIVLDGALYFGNEEFRNVFHPGSGSIRFRLPELLIAAGLGARLLAGRFGERLQRPMIMWWFTAAWITTAAVIGIRSGHSTDLALFEWKAVLYVVGGVLLAAGVPAEATAAGLRRLIQWSALVAAVLIATDALGLVVTGGPPGLRLEQAGPMTADVATIFSTLGLISFGLGLRDGHSPRGRETLATAVLLATPLVTSQRAALIALAVGLLVLLPFAAARHRFRPRVAPTQLALGLVAVGAFAVAPVALATFDPGSTYRAPFVQDVREAFESRGKVQSSQSRENQWTIALDLAAERPLFGHGLATTFRYFEPGPDEFREINITHNLLFDLMVRTGVVGVALFAGAIGADVVMTVRSLRRSAGSVAAALAIGCLAATAGILAKGMVESIFEKYLLATLLGLVLGAAGSARRSGGHIPATGTARSAAWT